VRAHFWGRGCPDTGSIQYSVSILLFVPAVVPSVVSRMFSRIGYGWVIVAAMLIVQTVASGMGFYNMSVYMAELAELMQRPLSALSFAVSIFFIAGGVFGLFVAELINRFQIRWIMVVASAICALALTAMSQAREIWQVYALFLIYGIGNTGVSLVIVTTLITRWFPGPNRSIALSIASTGLSLGGVTLTPLTAHLFNTVGVYESFPTLGIIFFVVIVPVAIFLVRLPKESDKGFGGAPPTSNFGYRDAVTSRFFLYHSVGYALCMLAQVGGIAHLYGRVDFLSDYETASRAVQALSLASIAFRFVGGVIATRISIRVFTLTMLVVQGVGLACLGMIDEGSQGIYAALLFGASMGNLLMLQPLWLAEVYTGPVYPRVYALASAISVVGVAMGPFLLGLIVDDMGYDAGYFMAAAVSVAAWILIAMAGAGPAASSEELAATGPVEK
jgi:MFS family permease